MFAAGRANAMTENQKNGVTARVKFRVAEYLANADG
jgi:hypothetical protein